MGQDWTKDGVRMERTGWRDNEISERHRQWGFNCPGVDLDFVMLEYNHGVPVAVVEYKHKNAREPNMSHPTYNALRHLADNHSGGALPFLVVFYCPEEWWFRVIPGNERAREVYSHTMDEADSETAYCVLSEQRFVRSLYYLRGVKLNENDKAVIARLNDVTPTVEAA